MRDRLFVYGSLMNDEVTDCLLGVKLNKQPAVLNDYRRVAVADGSYPAIFPCEGDSVEGLLVSGLTLGQWAMLDEFEGEQYQLDAVSVVLAGQSAVDCYAYAFRPECYEFLSDSIWSNEVFRREHMLIFLEGLG